ncbi:MAG TPA: hypothetical protein VG013_06170 [Gemmataceae bacterium]|nr:hypothetical protein [Gemmataceae bacterium]
MFRERSRWWRHGLLWACAAFVVPAGAARAAGTEADLRALIEEQGRQIQELKRQMDASRGPSAPAKDGGDKPVLDEKSVKNLVADYLKDNPGAGMPPSVQTGYDPAGGFMIRSAPAPAYVPWADESKIPFELRFRGRIQLDSYNYKVTDNFNHLTLQHYNPAVGDFSELEVKRLRLVWEGTAFDPNLRYHFELDGSTRGLGGIQNNRVIQTAGTQTPAAAFGAPGIGTAASPIGGGVTTGPGVRLFSAYVAYDFHGCAADKGCGPDCPDGTYKYAPTYTLIAGKAKPFFAFEEYLGSGNEQFVEYGMTEWYFDADNDNLQELAGAQIKAFDDRLYAMVVMTNGVDSQFANAQMDRLPGFNAGFWWDFGGTWNQQRKRWDLFGDCASDIDYSCNPVVRVGASSYFSPVDRRSIYGDDKASFFFTMPAGPNGTRLINLLNGDGGATNGLHAVDSFDAYTFEGFAAGKYHGFSILNDWFVRDLTNWKTVAAGNNVILYNADGNGAATVFPRKALIDFGTLLQGGYFIVPKKMELVARVSLIEGESGDLAGPRHGVLPANAFSHFKAAYEYSLGFNYYWKRQLLKWQTDVSYYQGGNPAGGGVSPAGFIAGVDGWMVRSQIQLAF